MIKAFFVVIDICVGFIGVYCMTHGNIRVASACMALLLYFAIKHHLEVELK